ncbi:ComEC/Rec2 family competence protein [Thermoleophilum album]|uniref:ComEC/Rec2 family competence protein n=1 Tax=Thermoleophilum album TaxID=29539 RepID=UPI00237C76E8|nr:ComEC/Rec2 family competence protein [Thermoleophilum album]WDT92977.1 ComEC/Rec2 family competence protein [Thermoleophilum album]
MAGGAPVPFGTLALVAAAAGLAASGLGLALQAAVAATLVASLAMLAACVRPARVGGLVLVAAAGTLAALVGVVRLDTLEAPVRELDVYRASGGVGAWRGRVVLLERPRPSGPGLRMRARIVAGVGSGGEIVVRTPTHSARDLPFGAVVEVQGRVRRTGGRGGELPVGTAAVLYATRFVAIGRRGGIAGTLDRARLRALRELQRALPGDRAELAAGLILGLDERIDPRVRDDFRATGLGHLLAVSGQNVALLVALVWPLAALIFPRTWPRRLLAAAAIVVYVPLAGAGTPLQRAAVMGIAALVAQAAARPRAGLHALALAACVTLALDPRQIHSASWQLSFAAVAGLLLLGRPLERTLELRAGRARASTLAQRIVAALGRGLRSGVAMTVAATVATAPVACATFGSLPLATLAANVVALPAVAPAMWAATVVAAAGQLRALGAPAAPLADAVALVAAPPLELALGHLEWTAATLAVVPQLAIGDTPPPGAEAVSPATAAVAALCALALAAVAVAAARAAAAGRPVASRVPRHGDRHPAVRPVALFALFVLLAYTAATALYLRGPQPAKRPTISFLDVGQGDAVLVQDGTGASVLFDTGPPEGRVARRVRGEGVSRLDAVATSHAARDHHGGLAEVVRTLRPRLILDGGDSTRDRSYRAAVALARRRGAAVVAARAGRELRVGKIHIRVLWPRARPASVPSPSDPNERAVVALVHVGRLVLLTSGDAESEALRLLPIGDVDVLKVPHHGSGDPGLPAVLARARPEVAVVQVGARNPFGHPVPSTLAALARSGAAVFRTDRDGTVRVTADAEGLHVATERRRHR